jgi:hypothetical protein
LIGYRGFKELAFVAGSGNSLWSIDSDLDRMYWEKHFVGEQPPKRSKNSKQTCSSALTATPALPGPVVFHAPVPGRPAAATNTTTRLRRVRPVYLLTGDGLLHQLNEEDGSELEKPRQFVTPGAPAQGLNISEQTLYTSTQAACGHPAAVWSLDTSEPETEAKSVKLGADIAGLGGVVLGSDGMAFVQTKEGPLEVDKGKFGDTLVTLNKDLRVSQYFVTPAAPGKKNESPDMNSISPLVVTLNGQQLVIAAGKDGRLYVLKASQLGGDDHHHYTSQSLPLPALDGNKSHGIWGGLSSWQDTDGPVYVLAPVWGPLSEELQAAIPGANSPHGSVVAFRLEERDHVITLTPAWVSPDLDSPVPPVIAKGVVFALANGKLKKGGHATLLALDGVTGKPIYSTGDQVTVPGNLTGLSIANGRVYFVTLDNTLQVFGKYLEH